MNMKIFAALVASVYAAAAVFAESAAPAEAAPQAAPAVAAEAVAQEAPAAPVASEAPAVPEVAPSAPSSVFRVSAWNMKWFPSGFPLKDGAEPNAKYEYYRIDTAARFIGNHIRPDVLLMEEIRDEKTCAELIGRMNSGDWKVVACSAFPPVPEAEIPTHQNAIISRFEKVESGFAEWQQVDGLTPPRGYVYAVLDIDGRLVAFFGVHLKSNFIPDEVEDKEAQARLNARLREISAGQLTNAVSRIIARDFGGRKVSDVFVGGDFNSSVFDAAYKSEQTVKILEKAGFSDCFAALPETNRYTMVESKYYPPTVFDYIFHRGLAITSSPEVSDECVTSNNKKLSDHKAVSVNAEW